jgi:hypothetical protein
MVGSEVFIGDGGKVAAIMRWQRPHCNHDTLEDKDTT